MPLPLPLPSPSHALNLHFLPSNPSFSDSRCRDAVLNSLRFDEVVQIAKAVPLTDHGVGDINSDTAISRVVVATESVANLLEILRRPEYYDPTDRSAAPLIVTSADRADIFLSLLAAHHSSGDVNQSSGYVTGDASRASLQLSEPPATSLPCLAPTSCSHELVQTIYAALFFKQSTQIFSSASCLGPPKQRCVNPLTMTHPSVLCSAVGPHVAGVLIGGRNKVSSYVLDIYNSTSDVILPMVHCYRPLLQASALLSRHPPHGALPLHSDTPSSTAYSSPPLQQRPPGTSSLPILDLVEAHLRHRCAADLTSASFAVQVLSAIERTPGQIFATSTTKIAQAINLFDANIKTAALDKALKEPPVRSYVPPKVQILPRIPRHDRL